MKRLIVILILVFAGLLSQAQDHIIIPAGQDTLYRMKIYWYYGVDPIQTKDGNYILPIEVLRDLQNWAKDGIVVSQKGTVKSMPVELAKLPVKDIKEIMLKEPEAEVVIKK
jgi:hypothetical protein